MAKKYRQKGGRITDTVAGNYGAMHEQIVREADATGNATLHNLFGKKKGR
jgi:hypothetical protein